MKDIKVSIICLAYNHEKYISNCLDSLLEQNTNFDYEILVHDDCSFDNTREILLDYKGKYPNIIKLIFEKENIYSKGFDLTYDLFKKAKGDYIAFCECDDFWCDKNKLQKQYDYLYENLDYVACVHNSKIVDIDNKQIGLFNKSKYKNDINLTLDDILNQHGYIFHISSLMCRKSVCISKPNYLTLYGIADYPLFIWIIINGKIRYFTNISSCYRSNNPDSWSGKNINNKNRLIKIDKEIIKMLNDLNINTNYKYNDEITKTIYSWNYQIYCINGDIRSIIQNNKYRKKYIKDRLSRIKNGLLKYGKK